MICGLRWFPRSGVSAFGSSAANRLTVAFVGGLLAMYGARMAGGCTSGNGLSGSMQLALKWLDVFHYHVR